MSFIFGIEITPLREVEKVTVECSDEVNAVATSLERRTKKTEGAELRSL